VDPLRVWARNFRTYPELEWTPQAGLTTILGRNTLGDGADSNGAGKSTVLEALFTALFGPALGWPEYLTVGGEASGCEVGCEFAHAGETYRVRRTYDAKGRGKTSLDLERLSADPLAIGPASPLTMNSQAETQAALTRLIGLSEATFVHSVFAPQGHRHFADPSLPPRERKDILTDALGLEVWDRLKALASADVREIETTLAGIAQRLGAFEDDLARKPELEAAHGVHVAAAAAAARELAEAETAEEKARTAHTEAKGAAERAATLTARRDTAQARLKNLAEKAEAAKGAAASAQGERDAIEHLTPAAARLESLELESRRLATIDLERAALIDKQESLAREAHVVEQQIANAAGEAEAARAEAKAARENASEAACVTCGQALHGEALAKAQASVEREAARHEAKATEHAEQARRLAVDLAKLREEREAIRVPAETPLDTFATVQADLQAAREAGAEITRREATLAALRASLATVEAPEFASEHKAAAAALAETETALGAIEVPDAEAIGLLAREAERASTEVATTRAADRQAQAELTTSEERLRNLAALADRAQESLAERERLTDRLTVLKALERSYGRDGIPALRLEVQAIPQIEATASEVLDAMGLPFRVELVTQRENKSGGLRDTLDVVVHEPGGARSYATYSGGERTRLEVALRLGIARLIAQRSSSACDLFALDELPWLDRSGQAALVEVLRGLSEYEKVVLVSHDEVLADSFDQALLVVRDETGSRLEQAA
jgi:exonuclease SbcC